jgi:hypothetical protein
MESRIPMPDDLISKYNYDRFAPENFIISKITLANLRIHWHN